MEAGRDVDMELNLMERETVIEVRGLTCAYGDVVVMQDLDFEIHKGEIFFVIGGSGCGKSTLLRHMIGLRRPAKGAILIDGDDIGSAEGLERSRILRRFGVAFQSGALFGNMSLLQNVMLPLEEYTDLPRDARELVARAKLSLVGLEASAYKMPDALSGGMQKRAALARAMALDPSILFLDEPSAGLDPVTSAELDALILSLARNLDVTFVIVSHELASIEGIGDRVVQLDREAKGIVALGPPKELKEHSTIPAVRRFFDRTRVACRVEVAQTEEAHP